MSTELPTVHAVDFTIDGNSHTSTVVLTPGYTTADDVPRILAIAYDSLTPGHPYYRLTADRVSVTLIGPGVRLSR